jgi:hypothetical protein
VPFTTIPDNRAPRSWPSCCVRWTVGIRSRIEGTPFKDEQLTIGTSSSRLAPGRRKKAATASGLRAPPMAAGSRPGVSPLSHHRSWPCSVGWGPTSPPRKRVGPDPPVVQSRRLSNAMVQGKVLLISSERFQTPVELKPRAAVGMTFPFRRSLCECSLFHRPCWWNIESNARITISRSCSGGGLGDSKGPRRPKRLFHCRLDTITGLAALRR